MCRTDFLGDASPYREKWGARFDFMYLLLRDHQRYTGRLGEKALYWSGVTELYRCAAGACGATIQMYHSIPTPDICPWIDPRYVIPRDLFESQMRFLSRHRQVVSFSRLMEMLDGDEPIAAGTVVLTFDDGYLDTLRVAVPILEKYGLPATVFPVTGYVGRGQNQWGDQLFFLFVAHTREKLDVPGVTLTEVDLCDPQAKAHAYDALHQWFKGALPAQRVEMLAYLAEQLRPEQFPPRLTMTWDEVRELVRGHPDVGIGLHGAEHIDLAAHDPSVSREDIEECLRAALRELGQKPSCFAFPYNHVSEDVCEIVRQLGFRSAVASGEGMLISRGSDRMALPRIEVCRSMSLFRFRTSGAYPAFALKRIRLL
jgi:peptidoglycan/xylan/chitin deacetylase (PgdA/CDA1 family)